MLSAHGIYRTDGRFAVLMSTITVTKETFPRYSVDEFGNVNVQMVTRIIDDEGRSTERYWRRSVGPDADIAASLDDPAIPPAIRGHLRAVIEAARTPEAVARHGARKAATQTPGG